MLIAIFDIEMPKKCEWDCPFCNGDGGWCQLVLGQPNKITSENERPKECPLYEIDEYTTDMFELEEIKEIADYLLVYYNSHLQGD